MDEPLVDTELADTAPQRRSGPWKLILIVAILTLIGIWLVPGEPPEQTAVSVPPQDKATPSAGAPSLLEQPAEEAAAEAEPATAAEMVDDRPGAKARSLIAEMRAAGELRLDDAFAAAEAAQAAGELPDAYLLYFFAAREGHVPSALALGRQADPASHDPASSVFQAPDLNQAHKWYQFAAENGDDEGRKQLTALRARVEQMAAGGDPLAQRISLLWQ
jgi:TPR repeat protein